MTFRAITVGALSVAFLALTAFAADEIKLDKIKCVMNPNGPAKAAKSVDYKGGKVFFCCDNFFFCFRFILTTAYPYTE